MYQDSCTWTANSGKTLEAFTKDLIRSGYKIEDTIPIEYKDGKLISATIITVTSTPNNKI